MSNITTANAGTYHLIRGLAGRYSPPRRSPWVAILAALALLAMIWPSYAHAESPITRTDLVAHFGVSATVNTALYGVYRKGFGMSGIESCWFAGINTMVIGIAYEMGQRHPDEADLWADLAGVVTSNFLMLQFEF